MEQGVSSKSSALRFVIILGIVSMCADATYEGARSITGAYLGLLGASGSVVGLVAGFGELIGYCFRLVIGYLSDSSRQYWKITTLGYFINTAAVPLLALAGSWQIAAALMLGERTGKAIRTPPRDVLLSYAALRLGGGFGFGIHEALDQIGAVLGPLAVAAVIYFGRGYQSGFAILLLPAVIGLIVLFIAQKIYPNPSDLEPKSAALTVQGLPRKFWIYLIAVTFIAAGYADFPLIAYHFQTKKIASDNIIPLFYALAMGVSGIAALGFGRLFDRFGISVLMLAALFSSLFPPLVFFGGTKEALLGMVLWGVGMGAQESTKKGTGNRERATVRNELFPVLCKHKNRGSESPTNFHVYMKISGARWCGFKAHTIRSPCSLFPVPCSPLLLKATVAMMVPPERRGSAFGIFNSGYGLSWFLGSALMGILYDKSITTLVMFSVIIQLAAIPILLLVNRRA